MGKIERLEGRNGVSLVGVRGDRKSKEAGRTAHNSFGRRVGWPA